ncbi:class I SAM-dependent methyltransferase [Cyclobacterium jeungdonense]|uniref:Class I SAM-dependent methyltransferase n=1 Tax=Cyclobacterium jeungdonense TaxID=708087 RepID=A0ABT8C460_9BACT|nr:class I SAM-dependent methyltransferase [Cyclobacterium jeungdonense]MDN3687152.1 class I SAM-dependent methyltransferase [Cyclobacterium jeungdonense]
MKQKIKTLFAPSDEPRSIGGRFRQRRFKFFEQCFTETFGDQEKIKILDVGGTESFWANHAFIQPDRISITLLNLEKETTQLPHVQSMAGTATDLSQFEDQSFDLVFSNSVIEHLFTYTNQVKMAHEIRRVGKNYFVQTPNKFFFLEPHYALPFFQFFPSSLAFFILTRTKFSRMQKWDPDFAKGYLNEIRLLSLSEMKNLFPESDIYYEKILGLNKSFVFHTLEKK